MPNHCEQDLWVSGPKTELNKFVEYSKTLDDGFGTSHVLDHNKFIPYPEHFKQMDIAADEARNNMKAGAPFVLVKDGFNSGGYEWCRENWGTKWGIYDEKLVYHKSNKARYSFQSAWSPASKIILAMSKHFPTLTFLLKYYECGAAYKGVYEVKGGEVIQDIVDNNYHGNRGG